MTVDMAPVLRAIQGKRVVRVVSTPGDDGQLMLDDGTLLTLFMSESDCCASAAGGWVVRPDDLDAVITNVEDYSILSLKVNVPGEDAVQVAVLGA